MATDLGAPAPTTSSTSAVASPPATRATRSGWRDPRLWIGILLVAASVVAGARLVGAADDTTRVWALARDLAAGETVQPGDLVATRVRFAGSGTEAGYFTVDDRLPADLTLARGVSAGELLPRAALGAADRTDTLEVPVAVDADQVPPSVGAGSVVDLYLVGTGTSGHRATGAGARSGTDGPALAAVRVVAAPPLDQGFSASGKRQLVLAVREKDARAFFRLLGSTSTPVLTVVRRG